MYSYSDNTSQPSRYYDMEVDLNKTTLREVERWLNDKISSKSSSNSSQGGNSVEESKFNGMNIKSSRNIPMKFIIIFCI